MIATGLNLVMTVIGFGVSTMFIVFVCSRLVCARIHFRNSRTTLPAAVGSDLGTATSYSLERGIHGLEPVIIASFPTRRFGDQSFSFELQAQCTVCLADYQEKDVLRVLPYCGHTFHITCIDIWLKQQSTCPICRISLRDWAMQSVHSSVITSLSSSESFIPDRCQYRFTQSDYLAGITENQRNVPPIAT